MRGGRAAERAGRFIGGVYRMEGEANATGENGGHTARVSERTMLVRRMANTNYSQ